MRSAPPGGAGTVAWARAVTLAVGLVPRPSHATAQEVVSGVVVVSSSSSLSHNGLVLVATGQVRPHISAATAGLFDGFSSAAKPSDVSRVRCVPMLCPAPRARVCARPHRPRAPVLYFHPFCCAGCARGDQIEFALTRETLPTGRTEIPFEFKLEPLPGKVAVPPLLPAPSSCG